LVFVSCGAPEARRRVFALQPHRFPLLAPKFRAEMGRFSFRRR
jgi:hypothetical protein